MDESRLTTTIPLVLEAFVDNLSTLTRGMAHGGSDVEVIYGMNASNRTADDIHIGDVEDHVSEIVTMKSARKPRNESYNVVINIFCSRHELQDAIEAAVALQAVAEDWIAENPNLGLDLPTLRVTEIRSNLNMTMDSPQNWRTHITMRPFVQCRLR